jgi:hypothetical protein
MTTKVNSNVARRLGVRRFDASEYLRDEADIAAYLEAAAAEEDPRVLASALAEEFRRLKGSATGQVLIDAMQAFPYRDVDIEPKRGNASLTFGGYLECLASCWTLGTFNRPANRSNRSIRMVRLDWLSDPPGGGMLLPFGVESPEPFRQEG